jgi:hypothetical protein
MVHCERGRDGLPTASVALVCGIVTGWPTFAGGDDGSDREKPFRPDGHTVVLYHFDEGQGNDAYDACGDAALTRIIHRLCRPEQGNAACAGTSVASGKSTSKQSATCHSMRFRSSGNILLDLVPKRCDPVLHSQLVKVEA